MMLRHVLESDLPTFFEAAATAMARRTRAALTLVFTLGTIACGTPPAATGGEAAGAGVDSSQGNIVGDVRLHDFESRVFGNKRKLRVWLPPGYDAAESRSTRYPVLFLNDGQNLFDSTTATLNAMEWRVDETVSALVEDGTIQPVIVVGIDNAGRRGRFREYFPYVDEYLDPPEADPQGTRYPAFLIDEVVPFIEARYRITEDVNGRGIGGSSAGALAAIYTVVHRPGTFGRLLVESPSIYVDDYHILKDARLLKQWPERIYFGVGTNEAGEQTCPSSRDDPELVRDVKRFQQQLIEAGVGRHRMKLVITPCAVHNESAWAERLPAALTFLFATRPAEAGKPSPAVALRIALQQTLRGPSNPQRGKHSWFSDATAGALRSVSVDSAGHATVDFEDLRALIPNASSSAGSAILLEELNAAVFGVDGIRSVSYLIEGSCEKFWEWLQYGCQTIRRP